MAPRITFIGGGSNQRTPVLVTDIVNTPSLREVEIVLPTPNGSLASPDSGRGLAGVLFGNAE
jgi:hypothetical protein